MIYGKRRNLWWCICFLTGCSLTPSYKRPNVPLDSTYDTKFIGQKNKNHLLAVDMGWRQFFQDDALQEIIAAALIHNQDLKTALLITIHI